VFDYVIRFFNLEQRFSHERQKQKKLFDVKKIKGKLQCFNVTLTRVLFQLKVYKFHCDSFFLFSRMIRSRVLSLPRISIISATPGPSLSPLSVVRRFFIRLANVKLFSDENSLRICFKFSLLNFSSFNSSTSESMISGRDFC
jgi:hypothetical protein